MKCKNCGEKMFELYATNGFVVYLCKNAKLKVVKQKASLAHGLIHCNNDIIAEDKMLRDRIVLDLARISKRITTMQKRLIA